MPLETIGDKPPSNWKKGVTMVLITWIFFTITLALSRAAGSEIPVATILLFQNGISLIVLFPFMLAKGKKSFKFASFRMILIRTIAGFCSFGFLFLAAKYTSLVNVVLMGNSSPLLIPLIIWFWRGKKIGLKLWLGILVGFIGIALILRPGGSFVNIGVLLGLCSAFFFSVSMIVQRLLIKKESSRTILFYYFFIATLVMIPLSYWTWIPLSPKSIILLSLMGLSSVCGQFLFLRAFRFQKPSMLAPFNYVAVVYAFFIDWFLWNQLPSLMSILGVLVVCLGGILSILEANGNFLRKSRK